MEEKTENVNYLIDGKLSIIPTKVIYTQIDEDEIEGIHLELTVENKYIISDDSDITEFAVVNLQRALPSNIKIACCQSCKHGNFCPYGDKDDEVFCLKDTDIINKGNLCDFFSNSYASLEQGAENFLAFVLITNLYHIMSTLLTMIGDYEYNLYI